ncbi:hypothetical protein JHK87_010941 [Glycine soja]|nr:hypothetical protein JHK87_010941 [Glycine soja]KAG5067338.1 hypothetical protein JHK86_011069 [Glycine max]
MIMVVSMMEILGEYTAVLTRVTENLLPRRSTRVIGGLRNLFASTTFSRESASFLVYF